MRVVKDYTLSLTLPLQRFVRSVLQLKGQKVRSPDYGQSNNSKGEGKNKNTTTARNEKQPTQKKKPPKKKKGRDCFNSTAVTLGPGLEEGPDRATFVLTSDF